MIAIAGIGFFLIQNKNRISSQTGKMQVAASFYPLYFFAEQIAGDKADVFNITPAGIEPHDYELTAQDIARIENSRLLILNGGGLEPWANNINQSIDSNRAIVVVAGEGWDANLIEENGQNIVVDPHVWLNPVLAKQMVNKIAGGFAEADPANRELYLANADSLKSKLSDLDKEYRSGLNNCAQRNVVASHAAFGYLAAEYGLNQVSIAGLSPDAEPSSRQLAIIIKFAKDTNVRYIFFESMVSPKLALTVAKEIGAETLLLNPLEGLSNEDLAQGKNYFTEMKANLKNLKIALQCQN